MDRTDIADESDDIRRVIVVEQRRIPQPGCVVMGELLIERDRARGFLVPESAKRRRPQATA